MLVLLVLLVLLVFMLCKCWFAAAVLVLLFVGFLCCINVGFLLHYNSIILYLLADWFSRSLGVIEWMQLTFILFIKIDRLSEEVSSALYVYFTMIIRVSLLWT